MRLEKERSVLAMREADVLEPRPLIKTGHDQKDTANNIAGASHRCKQRGAFERPLCVGGGKRKSEPYEQITGCKPAGRANGVGIEGSRTTNPCITQNHR